MNAKIKPLEESFLVEEIPWSFKEPRLVGAYWFNKYQEACKQLRQEARAARESSENPTLMALTQKKLRKLSQAKNEQAKYLEDVLSPLEVFREDAKRIPPFLLNDLYPNQNLLSYIDNIHRDWAWGEEENHESIKLIEAGLLDNFDFQDITFLGSGSSRLAFDFYQIYKEKTPLRNWKLTAVDINPLLLLTAKKVFGKKGIKLYDFPIAPLNFEASMVLNKLKAPQEVGEEFNFLFSDATSLPFADKSKDLIITPWLIDILPGDPRILISEIGRVLKKEGRWINFGPLGFTSTNPAHNFSIEELLDATTDSGFTCQYKESKIIPYLKSPYSQHSRNENTFCFNFLKRKDGRKDQETNRSLPNWLEDPTKAIPKTEKLEILSQTHQIYSLVLSHIDGVTPLSGLSKKLSPILGLSEAETLFSLKNFLSRIKSNI